MERDQDQHGAEREIARIAMIAKIAEIEKQRFTADQRESSDLVIARDRVNGKQESAADLR